MFDENKYRACFDEVCAPEGMERELLKMIGKNKNKRHVSSRTAIVLAAALVLLLSFGAVASAAGWFRVEDAVIGSLDVGGDSPVTIAQRWSEDGADAICTVGVKGSAEYEATKEWFEYYWGDDYESSAKGEEVWDEVCNQYGAFTDGAIIKLKGISARYGLKLLDSREISSFAELQVLYHAAGCDGLLKSEADHGDWHSGYYYENGSFKLEGEVSLAEGYDKPICYQLMNNQKGYLPNGAYLNIGAWENCEQWDYTTAEGVTVTIVHSENRDIVLANLENSVVAINIVDFEEYESGRNRADMEAFADSFDFTVIK